MLSNISARYPRDRRRFDGTIRAGYFIFWIGYCPEIGTQMIHNGQLAAWRRRRLRGLVSSPHILITSASLPVWVKKTTGAPISQMTASTTMNQIPA